MTSRLTAFATLLLLGCNMLGCSSDDNSKPVSEVSALKVVTTSPEANSRDVALDKEVRIVFTDALDPQIDKEAARVVDASGADVPGRFFADGKTLVFTPARYNVNTRYTVKLSSALRGTRGALETPFEFSFGTGATNSDNTKPPPDSFDPLGRGPQKTLGRMPEYAIVWSGNADKHIAVEDPPYVARNGATGSTTKQLAWNEITVGTEKQSITGQLDDDGWDEIVVLSQYPADTKKTPTLTVFDTIAANSFKEVSPALSLPSASSYDMAAADFDGDGRDEIVVVGSTPNQPIAVTVLDYIPGTGYGLSAAGTFTFGAADAAAYVKVAAGDVDGDGRAEAVIGWQVGSGIYANTLRYVVLDDAQHNFAPLFHPQPVKTGMPALGGGCRDSYFDLKVADLAGDGHQRIVFGVTEVTKISEKKFDCGIDFLCLFSGTLKYQCNTSDSLWVADPIDTHEPTAPTVKQQEGLELLTFTDWYLPSTLWSSPETRPFLPLFHTGNFEGNTRDDVVFHDRFVKFDPAKPKPTSQVIDASALAQADIGLYGATLDSKVGDVDGDMRDDLVLLQRNTAGLSVLHLDLDDAGKFVSTSDTFTQASKYSEIAGKPRLALPNVDQDSMIVQPTGHDVYLGENVIVAVLAAAPYSSKAGQDPAAASTSYGLGTTDSTSDGGYFNASAGVLIGAEWNPEVNIPFLSLKLGKIEVEGSLGAEGSYQRTSGMTRSESISYGAGGDNNLVIFEAYTYDRYSYRVIADSDSAKIGTTFTLNIPTGRRMMAASQEYYNANNGAGIDVDDSVIAAVPGDLTSYPSLAEANAIVKKPSNELIAMSSSPAAVTGGLSNSTTINLAVSNTNEEEYSVGAYISASVKVCGPSPNGWTPQICGGVEGDAHGGYAYSHEWSTDLTFSGTVGGIPAEKYLELNYGLGLFAYKTTLQSKTGEQQSFLVVNYFVQ